MTIKLDNIHEIMYLEKLSWKAKGLALFILVHPIVFSHPTEPKELTLLQCSKEGTDAVRSGIKELEEVGTLKKIRCRNPENGRIIGSTWEINFIHNDEEVV